MLRIIAGRCDWLRRCFSVLFLVRDVSERVTSLENNLRTMRCEALSFARPLDHILETVWLSLWLGYDLLMYRQARQMAFYGASDRRAVHSLKMIRFGSF